MPVTRLLRVSVTVVDLARTVAFFRDGLGLEAGVEEEWDDRARVQLLGLDESTTARSVDLAVGDQVIELVAFDPPGVPYPDGRASNDQWFEHIALVAGDIETVWQGLSAVSPEAITEGGPDLLPANTGGVTAFKFRDPDGHPLELIAFPAGVGDPIWQRGTGPDIRGYDHTAISVMDVERSLAFYEGLLGFRVGGRSLNRGPEQDRMDGLSGCVVDVVALQPPGRPTPHLELLHYRKPRGRTLDAVVGASDVASTRQIYKVDDLDGLVARLGADEADPVAPEVVNLADGRKAASIRDPDGHMIVLTG